MCWTLVALTLRRAAPHSKSNSGDIALSVALRFLRLFPFWGPGLIVDCKDPYLQEWIFQLNNTHHARGYTMKVEQGRPRLKPEGIYALPIKAYRRGKLSNA